MSAALAVSGLLVSSTGSALLRKVLYQIRGTGLHGQRHTFEKPWFTSWESAAACWVSILIFWGLQSMECWSRKRNEAGSPTEPLLTSGDRDPHRFEETKQPEAPESNPVQQPEKSVATWKEVWALIVPGLFSVASIIVQGMGLRYISASLSLMLSGSCIIFTAVLSVLLLKCHLNYLHFSGIALSLAGIAIVSVANLVWPDIPSAPHHHSNSQWQRFLPAASSGGLGKSEGTAGTVMGIILTLLSMLILAMRLVAEEFALQGSNMHPLQVLGYEGMWGTLVVGIIGLPIAQVIPGGDIERRLENTVDSFVMLTSNSTMSAINCFFFLSVIGLNIFGLMVTRRLGSVFRAVLLTSRTAAVWLLDLILFYMHVGEDEVGEPWTTPASWFQLFGFAVLLLGTVIYAQGSSAVAQDDESRKLAAADPEADGSGGADGSPDLRAVVSAVTRLRPYTSLYIPHGPRDISRRAPASGPAVRRAISLPQEPQILAASPSANGPPMANFNSAAFERHSYTPGLLEGSSPRSVSSIPSAAASGPVLTGMRRSTSRSKLFMQTLTHPSSWVLPNQLTVQVVHGASPSSTGALEDEVATSARARPEGPSTSRIVWGRIASVKAPASVFSDDLDEDGEVESGEDKRPALHGKPRPGQSPSPQSLLEFRRSTRRGQARMPSVKESDAEAPRISFDEPPQLSSSAPSDIQPQRSGSVERDPANEVVVENWQLPPLDLPESGQKHVLGQSPAAPILLSRRSTGRSKKASLPAFSESPDETDVQQDDFLTIDSPGDGPHDKSRGHLRNLSGSSGSSRSSRLGQSPTPAKLLEQRSAERKSLDRLPAFLEEGAEGSSSRSSSSSLNTSDEDERLARMRPKRGHQRAPHDSTEAEASAVGDSAQQGGSSPQRQRQPGLQKGAGDSSTTDLQWNGEPMSL